MSSFSSLEIGKRALLAQKFGLDVTSNNIANINTVGYSRRQAVMSETTPVNISGQFLGTGVITDNLRSFRSEMQDKEIRNNTSRNAGYELQESLLTRLESILAEPSDNGLSELTTSFFNTFDEISTNPHDTALRDHLLDTAKQLTDRFNLTAKQIVDMRDDVRSNIESDVSNINHLLKDIAELNRSIGLTKAETSIEAQTYVDEREVKLEKLSKYANIHLGTNDNGSVNVFMNGINVITDTMYNEVKAQESLNSATGERTITIISTDLQGNHPENLDVQNGELATKLKIYNETLDDNDSSSGYSVAKKLDEYANGIVQQVNALMNTGFGLNDTGTTPPGRNFFEPVVGNAKAINIRVSADVWNKPDDIPLSDVAGEDGNNSIALQIARLSSNESFIGDSTPTEFYATILNKIGNMGKEAKSGRQTTQLIGQQLETQRESIIGVNLDEEAISLVKFQKAFEASSRIVNVTDEILSTIVNLGR